jgi:hypothetical protein
MLGGVRIASGEIVTLSNPSRHVSIRDPSITIPATSAFMLAASSVGLLPIANTADIGRNTHVNTARVL